MPTQLQPIPYLAFDGTCKQAMDFYADVLGGTLRASMTFGEMPGDYPVPEEHKSRVMNAQVELPGGMLLYGGDTPPGSGGSSEMKGIMLALNFDTVAEAEAVFNRFADGGNVTMPFGETFWAERFGMVTDKFGTHWGINAGLRKL